MFFGRELPLWAVTIIIVLGRIVDMSLCSVRTVLTVKSKPLFASIIGFGEAFFWFLIVKGALDYIMVNPILDTFILAFSYAFGFALGTFLGGMFIKKFITTQVKVQVVLSSKNDGLVGKLNDAGYGDTLVICKGAKSQEEKYMLFIETTNKKMGALEKIIKEEDEKAFISVNEVQKVRGGFFGFVK